MFLSPAEYVIREFGGVRKTARAIGRAPSSVCLWTKPKEQKGRGGLIPVGCQKKILEVARAWGLDITPEDLVLGHRGSSDWDQNKRQTGS